MGVEVFSTFATDKFIRDGKVFKEANGGPALFIDQALTDLGVPHIVHSPGNVVVEILFTDQGEFGKVPVPPSQAPIAHRDGAYIVVSTLLDDWKIVSGKSPVYVDIQGFVRDGSDFGKKKTWEVPEELWSTITCVKGTEEEITYLDSFFSQEQKRWRQLIATKGPEGADVFVQGERIHVPAQPILNLPDTVGAGDTWFAAYVSQQVIGNSAQESAEFATKHVANFLKRKIK